MNTPARHWITLATALVATIGASLAMAFEPAAVRDATLDAGYGVHSGLAAVAACAPIRTAL
jgi:hypothetical protein